MKVSILFTHVYSIEYMSSLCNVIYNGAKTKMMHVACASKAVYFYFIFILNPLYTLWLSVYEHTGVLVVL